MDGNRMFMIGVILLLLGIQFRIVESFELTPWATQVVEKRLKSAKSSSTTSLVSQTYNDPWLGPSLADAPATRSVSPPRKLALSFISVGAILILISPAHRK